MTNLPDHDQQISLSHASLIHQVVRACRDPEEIANVEPMLDVASKNGWKPLVNVIRKILAGSRSDALMTGLDNEDLQIVKAILEGLQNPETLPDIKQQADAGMAAPGIAKMVHFASTGDAHALQAVAFMAQQMIQTRGDLRQLGGIMNKLIDGSRDPDELCEGMTPPGEKLVLDILKELDQLTQH
jgi:hypothetical protein